MPRKEAGLLNIYISACFLKAKLEFCLGFVSILLGGSNGIGMA